MSFFVIVPEKRSHCCTGFMNLKQPAGSFTFIFFRRWVRLSSSADGSCGGLKLRHDETIRRELPDPARSHLYPISSLSTGGFPFARLAFGDSFGAWPKRLSGSGWGFQQSHKAGADQLGLRKERSWDTLAGRQKPARCWMQRRQRRSGNSGARAFENARRSRSLHGKGTAERGTAGACSGKGPEGTGRRQLRTGTREAHQRRLWQRPDRTGRRQLWTGRPRFGRGDPDGDREKGTCRSDPAKTQAGARRRQLRWSPPARERECLPYPG